MGTFRNEAIRRLFIGLGIVVALYLGFVMMPMAKVPLYTAGVLDPSVPGVNTEAWEASKAAHRKSGLRIAIEGRLHWLGII
jgi:hypothetical protein